MPKKNTVDALKAQDTDYQAALQDAVGFIHSRRQAMHRIAGTYHLDKDDLQQEAYEVLLTCLRDFNPLYTKASGETIQVKFATFFGSRMENRAKEIRNTDSEYQARHAMTDKMTDDEKKAFRQDPPLLVQHLDMQTTSHDALDEEVSLSHRLKSKNELERKKMMDNYFDRRLNQLILNEKDDKKRLILQHVKMGGIASFNEIAYQFGVTDSRASQVFNDLIDAFYVQRLVEGDLDGVAYDFDKLKFNPKRIGRLLEEALDNSFPDGVEAIKGRFAPAYPQLAKRPIKLQGRVTPAPSAAPSDLGLKPYHDVLTPDEQAQYPEVSIGLRPLGSLRDLGLPLLPPEPDDQFNAFVRAFDATTSLYPAVVTEEGVVLDGMRRIQAAKAQGKTDYLCVTRHVPDAAAQKILRVVINGRTHKDDKRVMYHCVAALKALGFSQQPVADLLQTSRTNVIVYDKIHKNAGPALKQLFEDGLIQVTNASTAADLNPAQQDQLADFIQGYGASWGKGAPFNTLLKAVLKDTLPDLVKEAGPRQTASMAKTIPTGVADPQTGLRIQALEQQLTAATLKLKDAEIWAAQREGVIAQQSEVLEAARGDAEALKRELEAHQLMAFGGDKVMDDVLKQLKNFLHITERLAAAEHFIIQAGQELRRSTITRAQLLELDALLETLDQSLTLVRADVQHKRGVGAK